jgi:hypothetical protein
VQDGEDQQAVPVRREGHGNRIQGRPGSGDCPWLAGAARKRNVCEVHASRR